MCYVKIWGKVFMIKLWWFEIFNEVEVFIVLLFCEGVINVVLNVVSYV